MQQLRYCNGFCEGFTNNNFFFRHEHLQGQLQRIDAEGLTLPTLTGIMPWLTPLAAAGLLLITVGAAILHLRRAAYPQAVGDSLVLAFVAAIGYLTLCWERIRATAFSASSRVCRSIRTCNWT